MRMRELLEAAITPQGVQSVNVEDLRTLLYTRCSEFMANNQETPFYRGVKSSYDSVVMIDPTVGSRSSESISNHYTLLMDNSPYYQGWPKRSKSLICTTNSSYASEFAENSSTGEVRVIIPFNGSLIGVAPFEDIWSTKADLSPIASYFTHFNDIPVMLHELKVPDNNYQAMLEYMSTPDFYFIWEEHYPDVDLNDFDLIGYLHKIMSPEATGMQLSNTKNFKSMQYQNRECWIGGKCLSIKTRVYEQIVGAVT